MRVFKTSVIDNKTNYTMLLSDVSYNNACFWLYSKGYKDPEKTITDYKNNITTLEFLEPTKVSFVYDENRGYLMIK